MVKRAVAVSLVVAFMAITFAGPVEAAGDGSRKYVAGGSSFGVRYICNAKLDFDIGGVCNMSCGSDDTCEVTVVDDVRGTDIWFRVCVDGEELCRPHLYWAGFGTRTINNAAVIDVVPVTDQATTGIVTVS